MSKSDITRRLEKAIYTATIKQGVFGCFEVTIGWFGKERVDFITYDTKNIWRCYEIKSSVADFRSEAYKTFCGNYNYYVMTKELYEKVKLEIPTHIGVYIEGRCVKRPKRQEVTVEEEILKNSLIRSLAREADKLAKSNDPDLLNRLRRSLAREQEDKRRYSREYTDLKNKLYRKYGRNWEEVLELE
ncbi:hypothetical protein CPT_Moonbeam201 [Bacillus phage Moonbeam]|uniref:MmcB family DNA repair protein n=1 Tax=Bacillus phage Moonbeam TaxID=1540091 RepID=A0A0A0RPQ3_9CAUD|nr:hypothetical protein CPT_Moonbeam201 [Bacillus phage Moonbeam]AIW03599.1 hypothetical protein CPT_Moonbeam201 [Bacillus phage Moonbeam]